MTPDPITQLRALARLWLDQRCPTPAYQVDAALAILACKFHLITSPDGSPYLLRMWLTKPARLPGGLLESGDSTLLHWILQPDNDRHLHDHPWEFKTTHLAGGYLEETEHGLQTCRPPSTFIRRLGDPHRIHALLAGPGDLLTGYGGAWTQVTTGPRMRPWGFYVGAQWIDHAEYLAPTLDLSPQPDPGNVEGVGPFQRADGTYAAPLDRLAAAPSSPPDASPSGD